MFRITQGYPRFLRVFAHRTFTFFGPAFQPDYTNFQDTTLGPTTPGAKLLVWADPLSLATTYGIAFAFFSSGY